MLCAGCDHRHFPHHLPDGYRLDGHRHQIQNSRAGRGHRRASAPEGPSPPSRRAGIDHRRIPRGALPPPVSEPPFLNYCASNPSLPAAPPARRAVLSTAPERPPSQGRGSNPPPDSRPPPSHSEGVGAATAPPGTNHRWCNFRGSGATVGASTFRCLTPRPASPANCVQLKSDWALRSEGSRRLNRSCEEPSISCVLVKPPPQTPRQGRRGRPGGAPSTLPPPWTAMGTRKGDGASGGGKHRQRRRVPDQPSRPRAMDSRARTLPRGRVDQRTAPT